METITDPVQTDQSAPGAHRFGERTGAPAAPVRQGSAPASADRGGAPVHRPAAPAAPVEVVHQGSAPAAPVAPVAPLHRPDPSLVADPTPPPAGWKLILLVAISDSLLIAVIAFAFSFGNVWDLAKSVGIESWISPLIQPVVDLSVLGLVVLVQWLALAGVAGKVMRDAKITLWLSGVAMVVLNAAPAVVAGIVTHDQAEAARAFGRAGMEAVVPALLIAWSHLAPMIIRAIVDVRERYRRATVEARRERARIEAEWREYERTTTDRLAAERAAAEARTAELAAAQARADADRAAAELARAEALVAAEQIGLERAQAEIAAAEALAGAERAEADRLIAQSAADRAAADRDRAAAERLAAVQTRAATPPAPPRRAAAAAEQSNVASLDDRAASHREALRAIAPHLPADVTSWAEAFRRITSPTDATVTQSRLERLTGMGKRRILAALEHGESYLPWKSLADERARQEVPA
jgi:hypothetical protein